MSQKHFWGGEFFSFQYSLGFVNKNVLVYDSFLSDPQGSLKEQRKEGEEEGADAKMLLSCPTLGGGVAPVSHLAGRKEEKDNNNTKMWGSVCCVLVSCVWVWVYRARSFKWPTEGEKDDFLQLLISLSLSLATIPPDSGKMTFVRGWMLQFPGYQLLYLFGGRGRKRCIFFLLV